ncbi:hypothetical protein AFK68_16930, partial [Hydrocoleum sp. CS-953]|uniref:protein kinase domain-containing protein n=1 Tax=Hydrocoleum sp. CS-953 TaxID=1671698 RepID=UPI000BC7FB18
MTNKILINRYKIISELGKGSFGTTYLAVDLDLPNQPQCVVKQLAPSDPRPKVFQVAKKLFEKEAKTLQNLGKHNQIPKFFDYFEEEGKFYLVQEFIEVFGSFFLPAIKRLIKQAQIKDLTLEKSIYTIFRGT